jgi:hypothetical protein
MSAANDLQKRRSLGGSEQRTGVNRKRVPANIDACRLKSGELSGDDSVLRRCKIEGWWIGKSCWLRQNQSC